MAIKEAYKSAMLDFIKTLGVKAVITIGGQAHEFPILDTLVDGDTLKHFVYLQNETGTITSAKLVDNQMRELQTHDAVIQKGADGLVVVFGVTVNIREAK